MGIVTIERGAEAMAAAAVYGALNTLYLAGHTDAMGCLMGELGHDLADRVTTLAEANAAGGFAIAMRERAAAARKMASTSGLVTEVSTAAPTTPQSWADRVGAALVELLKAIVPEFPGATIATQDAFPALVRRVQDACLAEDIEPMEVLQRLGKRLLAASVRLDQPAAFLAAKVRDWEPEDEGDRQW